MHNKAAAISRFPFSPVALMLGIVGLLVTVYIGLIAIIMSYAALTMEFSESVRGEEAAVATLEGAYLNAVSEINGTDHRVLGYEKPVSQAFVREVSGTALR